MEKTVLARVAALPRMSLPELKKLWRDVYGEDPPRTKSTFLVRRLAYRIQELCYGVDPAIDARIAAQAPEFRAEAREAGWHLVLPWNVRPPEAAMANWNARMGLARMGVIAGEAALVSAAEGAWLAPGAVIVWEEGQPPAPPSGFELLDQRRYGETWITLLRTPV